MFVIKQYIFYTSFKCAVTKADDLRLVREVSSQVTKCGANLYQLLSQEITLRQARHDALAQPLDISVIEKDMRFLLNYLFQHRTLLCLFDNLFIRKDKLLKPSLIK